MKISQLVCVYPPYKGGIGATAKLFTEILKQHGHQITVLTPEYHSEQINHKAEEAVLLKPCFKYGNAAFVPSVIKYLKHTEFLFLHYPFFGGAWPVWFAKKVLRFKFKLLIHYHMDVVGLPWYVKPLTWPEKSIRNSLFNSADVVTCASLDYVKNGQMSSYYHQHKLKWKEISFGVDVDAFAPPVQKQANEKFNLLFVGAMDKAHYFKGIPVLFEAIKDLDLELKLIGGGDMRSVYEQQAKDMGIGHKVMFLGKIEKENLIKVLGQSDALVLPSVNSCEAFGLVLLEAMACGLPVIASNLPGVRSVFSDSKQGLLAKVGDKDDLKEKIQWMINNPEKRREMGLSARSLVLEKYDMRIMGKRLNDVILEI